MLWRNGRVVLPETYRERARSVADGPRAGPWSTVLVGTLTLLLAGVLAVRGAPVAAAAGVGLFLAAGVAAGAERRALTVGLAVSAIVWTALGIGASLDPSPVPGFGLAVLGLAGAVVVGFGGWRLRSLPGAPAA